MQSLCHCHSSNMTWYAIYLPTYALLLSSFTSSISVSWRLSRRSGLSESTVSRLRLRIDIKEARRRKWSVSVYRHIEMGDRGDFFRRSQARGSGFSSSSSAAASHWHGMDRHRTSDIGHRGTTSYLRRLVYSPIPHHSFSQSYPSAKYIQIIRARGSREEPRLGSSVAVFGKLELGFGWGRRAFCAGVSGRRGTASFRDVDP